MWAKEYRLDPLLIGGIYRSGGDRVSFSLVRKTTIVDLRARGREPLLDFLAEALLNRFFTQSNYLKSLAEGQKVTIPGVKADFHGYEYCYFSL